MSVHLLVPFQIKGGEARTVPDGTLEEVAQNVEVIVATRKGECLTLPSFGVSDFTFGPQGQTPTPSAITDAVGRWEPRAVLEFDQDGASTTIRVGMR